MQRQPTRDEVEQAGRLVERRPEYLAIRCQPTRRPGVNPWHVLFAVSVAAGAGYLAYLPAAHYLPLISRQALTLLVMAPVVWLGVLAGAGIAYGLLLEEARGEER